MKAIFGCSDLETVCGSEQICLRVKNWSYENNKKITKKSFKIIINFQFTMSCVARERKTTWDNLNTREETWLRDFYDNFIRMRIRRIVRTLCEFDTGM